MTSRRALVVIGLLAVVYNCLRAFVSITGKTWSLLPAFLALPFTDAQSGCSLVLTAVALLLAQFTWRRDYHATLLPSAGWGATRGAAAGFVSIYLNAANMGGAVLALYLLTPVLMGFHSAFHLGSRGKSSLPDAVLASLLSLVLFGCALGVFAFDEGILWGMVLPVYAPLAILAAFLSYRLRKPALRHRATV